MTRALVAVGALLLSVVVALALYLTFADLGRFRPEVEAAASRALGREFRIAGEFAPKIFPRPSLVAADVTLANADWGAPTPMISIGKVSVEIGLWSLLFGPIRIKTLDVQDVAILLEQNASGARNWADAPVAPPEPAADVASQGLPAIIELASIGNVSVAFKGPETDDFAVALATLSIRTAENGATAAEANGQVSDIPFAVDATIAAAGDRGTQIELNATIADATVLAHALVNARQIDFDASVAELNRLAEAFSITGLPAAPLQLDGSLILGAERYELRGTTVKLLGTESSIDAVIPRESGAPVDFEVSVSTPSLAELDARLPALALTSTATAQVAPERIRVDPLKVQLGASDFSGSVEVGLGEPISFVVRGESNVIDLAPFQGTAAADTEQAVEASADAANDQWFFGEEELRLDRITTASVDAEISAGELRSRDLEARNLTLAFASAGDTLRLTTRFDVADGGAAEGNVVLAVAGDRADLTVEVDAHDLRLNLASGDVEDPTQIPPVGLSASLSSSGRSPRALVSAANGRLVFTQGRGRIDNSAIGLASGDIVAQLFSALNPFAKDEQYTNWDCTVVRLNVKDGVAVLDPMLAQAEKLLILGGGTIDLSTEELDIEFNTKPRSGVGLTADMFVTPFVKVGGTLKKPGVGLNAQGTLLAGGAAMLTGGLSLLVRGMADRATAERDQCAQALVEAANAAAGTQN